MTDFDDDFNDDTDEGSENGPKALREAARDGKRAKADAVAARAEADAARKEIALLKAGFDPDSKNAKALLKLHEGEWTADALKATAAEYEWGQAVSPAVPAAELAALDQFAAASTGGETSTSQEDFAEAMEGLKTNWHANSKAAVLALLKANGVVLESNTPSPLAGAAVGPVTTPFG